MKTSLSATAPLKTAQQLLSKQFTKPTTNSPIVDSAPPMVRPIVKPTGANKQKRGRLAMNSANKKAKTS